MQHEREILCQYRLEHAEIFVKTVEEYILGKEEEKK